MFLSCSCTGCHVMVEVMKDTCARYVFSQRRGVSLYFCWLSKTSLIYVSRRFLMIKMRISIAKTTSSNRFPFTPLSTIGQDFCHLFYLHFKHIMNIFRLYLAPQFRLVCPATALWDLPPVWLCDTVSPQSDNGSP